MMNMYASSIKKAHNIDGEDVYLRYIAKQPGAPALRTYRAYLCYGQKYTSLAAAGT